MSEYDQEESEPIPFSWEDRLELNRCDCEVALTRLVEVHGAEAYGLVATIGVACHLLMVDVTPDGEPSTAIAIDVTYREGEAKALVQVSADTAAALACGLSLFWPPQFGLEWIDQVA